jgi:hypothetical protein
VVAIFARKLDDFRGLIIVYCGFLANSSLMIQIVRSGVGKRNEQFRSQKQNGYLFRVIVAFIENYNNRIFVV